HAVKAIFKFSITCSVCFAILPLPIISRFAFTAFCPPTYMVFPFPCVITTWEKAGFFESPSGLIYWICLLITIYLFLTLHNFPYFNATTNLFENRIEFGNFYRFINVFSTYYNVTADKFFDFGVRSVRYHVIRFHGFRASRDWQKRVSFVHQFVLCRNAS